MSKKYIKPKTKKLLLIVVSVMAGLLALAFLGNVTGGFANVFKPDKWTFREPNTDNLWQSVDFAADDDGVIAEGADGVTVELTEDNEIKVKGTAEVAQTIELGKVVLNPHTAYVFDSSLSDGSNKTMYMVIKNGDTEIISSYSGAKVIAADTFTEATEVTISLVIAEGFVANRTLKPILCTGANVADAVDFYN